ncbi:MAG: ABC transporter substrate-binding protein [Rhodospirillales bacterium]|nr:ABC transporter substrate-binding protein [Rhodospirillales bacterium]
MSGIKRRQILASAPLGLAGAALAGTALAPRNAAAAEKEVLIGCVYPLSGPAAQVGHDAQAALQVMADIVNGNHAIPMLMGKGGGIAGLGGAKIKLIFADSQNNPQIAQSETQRLITQQKVVAIVGSYTSATAVTISQVCNRYQVPYISAENSAPSLSEQGLTWFFRPSPTDNDFSQAMFDFLEAHAKETGKPIKSVAIIHENSVFGSDSARIQTGLAKKAGIKVAADISYQASTPSLQVEVERLRAANADVVLPSSYTSDAILMVRTMHDLGYKPKAILAQDAGFIDPTFLKAVGPLAEGVMSRSSFSIDAVKSRPAIPAVNAMYKAANGNKDLNDLTSREVTALQVLADALNRAKSTNNMALRTALRETDIPGDQTIMPWKGIKFDKTGQNIEGNPVIMQYQKGEWHTIFPVDVATATVEGSF